MTAAPVSEGSSTASSFSDAQRRYPERPARERQVPRTLTSIVDRASREMILHITTTLSRSWDDLSRVFGRARDAIAYERWMHATFNWALSPLQRLLPSAAWPMASVAPAPWGMPPPFAPYAYGMSPMFAGVPGGFASPIWGRPATPPFAQPQPAWGMRASPNNVVNLVFAPLFGVVAGWQSAMPGMGFVLFF